MNWFNVLKETGEYAICRKCKQQFKLRSHKTKVRVCNKCKRYNRKIGTSRTSQDPKITQWKNLEDRLNDPDFKILSSEEWKRLPKEDRKRMNRKWRALGGKGQRELRTARRSKRRAEELNEPKRSRWR